MKDFDIAFPVYSQTNGCAASDLVPRLGRQASGVLYKLSSKDLKELKEVERPRYEGKPTRVIDENRRKRKVRTFVVRETERRTSLATTGAYISWIIHGLRDHGVPEEYIPLVIEAPIETNQRAGASAAEPIRLIRTL